MPLSVLFIHAPSAAFAEGLMLGSTNIAASRIGGVGRVAPPTPLGSGGTPAIFGYFPLLESNKHKTAHATTGADNRKTISLGVRGFPPAGFATFARTKVEKGWLGYKAWQ